MGLKRVIQNLWEERIESQPLGPLKKERSTGDFLGETSKEEYSEKIRKGPATNVADTILILEHRAKNGGN